MGLFLQALRDKVADKRQGLEEFDGRRVGSLCAPDELSETGLCQDVSAERKLAYGDVAGCELSQAKKCCDCDLACGCQTG